MQVYAGCMCQHNTEGVHCDQCATGFNNVPWAPGTDTEANACQGMFLRGSDRRIVLPGANKTCKLWNALQPVSMCLHWLTGNTSPSEEKAMQNDTCWDGTVAVRASNQNNAHSDIPKLGKHSGIIFSTSSWVIICLWCATDELGVDCLKFTITAEHKALNEGSILAMYICTYIYIHVCRYWSCLGMSISFGTSWIIYMFNERGCRGVWEIEGVHMEKSRAEQNWWMAAQKAEANPQACLPPHVSFILWW